MRHLPRLAAFGLFAALALVSQPAAAIDFGDDASRWANDGECDDPRFSGPGMTQTPLLDSDILHDATDCRQAFDAGRIVFGKAPASEAVDFGDDAGRWANDGECDDPRFEGPGMTETPLLDSDIRHDATDCRQAFDAGRLRLK
ncbi:hypothetical protein [Afifella pfennigii]|uniref:hypothetical protein n=1 Tax=Afifella pfennigii TaxID=209897 RepID=UPI0012EB5445|nr:hypothetical protein [Afifella pfennigii]